MKSFSVLSVIFSLFVVFVAVKDTSGQVGIYINDCQKPVVSKSKIKSSDCQNFDTLTVGGYVAEQLGGLWTTWSGQPGGMEDAIVSNDFFVSDSNSFVVNTNTVDLIYRFDTSPFTSGAWMYSHYMYVPSGFSGYFNVQSDPLPGVAWVMEMFFDDGGAGHVAIGYSNTNFTYSQDTWINVSINFDLNNNLAEVKIDEDTVLFFETTNSIGGIDYYGDNSGGAPGAYYDDICFEEGYEIILPPPPYGLTAVYLPSYIDVLLNWNPPIIDTLSQSNSISGFKAGDEIHIIGYNIYNLNWNNGEYQFLDYTTDTSYIHLNAYTWGDCYKVSAVYFAGFESEMSDEACVYLGVEEYSSGVLNVYPNPATDVVNVKSDVQINSVKVYNYAGQVIVNEDVNSMMYNINTSQYQSGIYFFRIETDEGTISKRIIIQY